jgi:hypothetical protein
MLRIDKPIALGVAAVSFCLTVVLSYLTLRPSGSVTCDPSGVFRVLNNSYWKWTSIQAGYILNQAVFSNGDAVRFEVRNLDMIVPITYLGPGEHFDAQLLPELARLFVLPDDKKLAIVGSLSFERGELENYDYEGTPFGLAVKFRVKGDHPVLERVSNEDTLRAMASGSQVALIAVDVTLHIRFKVLGFIPWRISGRFKAQAPKAFLHPLYHEVPESTAYDPFRGQLLVLRNPEGAATLNYSPRP